MTDISPRVVRKKKRGKQPQTVSNFTFTPDQTGPAGRNLPKMPGSQEAWEIYAKTPFPTRKDEPWRRTDISNIQFEQYTLPDKNNHKRNPLSYQGIITRTDNLDRTLVFGDHIDGESLEIPIGQGVIFTDLKTALEQYPQIVEKISGKAVSAQDGKFAALNAALANTGFLLYVPRGVVLADPLKALLWLSQPKTAFISHVMVYLEENSQATLFYELASDEDVSEEIFHSVNFEVMVEKNASLHLVELQNFEDNVINFTHERLRIAENGSLDMFFGAFGSKLTKSFLDVDLAGAGANAVINGAYLSDGEQHLDLDTQQNHLAPHTTSALKFKGALLGKSRTVWQGMVYVAPDGQKTDGYQTNNNLILSRLARADSIPGLEILADDVRCSHGATVGKIDEDQVFYLLSRGIPHKEAEKLLIEGYFNPVLSNIASKPLREQISTWIQKKLESYYG
jgi:Fe-S cluster assembly protein SufD